MHLAVPVACEVAKWQNIAPTDSTYHHPPPYPHRLDEPGPSGAPDYTDSSRQPGGSATVTSQRRGGDVSEAEAVAIRTPIQEETASVMDREEREVRP